LILNQKILGYNITISFFLLILLLFTSCINICKNEILTISFSPNEKYKAIAFIRTCGTTTNFSPQVSILNKNEKFSDNYKGNIFIGNNSDNISIYWESDTCLVVLYNVIDKDIFKKNFKYENIEIKYIHEETGN